MSFFDFLEKIRNKPRHIRTQIMWGCVVISMLLVVGFWSLSFKASINNLTNESIPEKEITDSFQRIKENTPTLLGSIKSSFSAFWKDLKEKDNQVDQLDQEWEELKNTQTIQEEEKNYQLNRLPSRP